MRGRLAPMKFRPMFRMLMNMQGVNDRSKVTYAVYGKAAERLTSTTATRLPAKHFLQEDQYDAVAESIQRIAGAN